MQNSEKAGEQHRARSFAPVIDEKVRVLVLGSLPGAASLRAGQYYAHPQNQFWRLMGAVMDAEIAPLSYEERLRALLAHGVGLWDMIAEAHRPGSLDSAIRDAQTNAVERLISQLPQLRLVAFNGQKSSSLGARHLSLPPKVERVTLPSSSPAHTLSFAAKLAAWRAALRPGLTQDLLR